MKRLADDLYQLRGFPRNLVNVYLLGDVLVDAGTRYDWRRILPQLRGRTVTAHALTHAHPDHQGSSHRICETLDLPLWCGEADADAMETTGSAMPGLPTHWLKRLVGPLMGGPPHPVTRRLRAGDEVGGFTVIETPGHTNGHLAFWRASDRALVLGDVLFNVNILTGRIGLREPPTIFTPDPARNRQSIRDLVALNPQLVAFGHGPPLRDPRRLAEFADSLPA